MTPTEAGFDGDKGIRLDVPSKGMGHDVLYRLKRGKTLPKNSQNKSLKNMLIWHYPDDSDSKLLFCNSDGEWFNLTFEPINIGE
jgi:hypothetical protein